MLTPVQAKEFYDRFGSKQDAQAFYEDRAVELLVSHGRFDEAKRVLEFGCGTGRLAERLLARELPPQALYVGLDLSSTMVKLASARLARFGARAEVRSSDGTTRLAFPEGSFDRVVSTYVTDLLPEQEIASRLREARRVLQPGGRLALAGLAHGQGPLTRLVSRAWTALHRRRPRWVGGCRPIEALRLLDPGGWEVILHQKVSAWGITSEALVVRAHSVRDSSLGRASG